MVHDHRGQVECCYFHNRNDHYEEILEVLVAVASREDALKDTGQKDHHAIVYETN